MSTQQFEVQGMTCGHCEKAVQAAIRSVDPQAEIRIDRSRNLVEITTAKDRETLASAIREEGYTVAA